MFDKNPQTIADECFVPLTEVALVGRLHARRRAMSACLALTVLMIGACARDGAERAQGYIESGDRFVAEGRFKEAEVEFKNALQQNPLAAVARVKLADASMRSGDFVQALRESILAADQLPDDLGVQLKAGTLLLYAGRFEEAGARAEKILAKDPRHAEAHLLRAYALIGMKDLPNAVNQVTDAIAMNPDRGEIYANLGAIEQSRGDNAAAEQAFKKAVELAPESLQAHLAIGNFYWLTGRWPQAGDALKRAVALAPRDPVANRAVANYYLATNQFREAEAPLKLLYELSKSSADGLALADFYVARGNAGAARAALEPLLKESASAGEASLRLATIDYRSGRKQEAHAQLDKLIASSTNEKALLVKARFLQTERRFGDALTLARKAVAANPKSTTAQFLVGQLASAVRQPDEAISAYEEVLRLNPVATDASVALASLQLAAGRNELSLGLATEALRRAPSRADARLIVVQGLLEKGDLRRAETELNILTKQEPRSPAVETQMGLLEGRKENLAAARQHFEKALALQPGYHDALVGLVATELRAKRPAEARAVIDEALTTRPDAANLLLAARTYAATGVANRSEGFLRQAIERDSAYLPAYVALGQLYVSQGRLRDARAEFETLSKRTPEPAVALTMIGILHQAEGNTSAAQEQYERVIALNPRAAVASNNLASIFADSKTNLDRALELAQNAAREMPDDPSVNDTLGYVLLLKGFNSQAERALAQSVKLQPTNALYRYHLGMAHMAAGNRVAAKEMLSSALKLDPAFKGADDAKKRLAQLADV